MNPKLTKHLLMFTTGLSLIWGNMVLAGVGILLVQVIIILEDLVKK